MEKKTINLTNYKEDVTILLPHNAEVIKPTFGNYIDEITIKIPKDPLDLVPKSWEEYLKITKSYIEDSDFCVICHNKDRASFNALIKLRILWHEWVKVLGTHEESKDRYVICHNQTYDTFVPVGCNKSFKGLLCFAKESHAEKFIECFGDLLEKAKILL